MSCAPSNGTRACCPWSDGHALNRFNVGYYLGWAITSAARGVGFGCEVVSKLFKSVHFGKLPSEMSSALLGVGGLVASIEVATTAHVFCKALLQRREGYRQLDQHAEKSRAFELTLMDPATKAALLATPTNIDESIIKQAEAFEKYETAALNMEAQAKACVSDGLAFARDSVAQGGGVGISFARVIAKFASTAVNIGHATIAGNVASILCGIGHLGAGYHAFKAARTEKKEGKQAKGVINAARETVEVDAARLLAQPSNANGGSAIRIGLALNTSRELLALAEQNEEKTLAGARNNKFVAKWRMGYGATSVVLGAASLGVFVFFALTPVGMVLIPALGVIAMVAGVAWVWYASRRNKAKLPESCPELSQRNTAVADLVDSAFELLRDRSTCPEARKLVKATLRDLGVSRTSMIFLKVSRNLNMEDAARTLLKKQIRNLIDGDGVRRAAREKPVNDGVADAPDCVADH